MVGCALIMELENASFSRKGLCGILRAEMAMTPTKQLAAAECAI